MCKKAKQKHIVIVFKLSASSVFAPSRLSACVWSELERGMLICWWYRPTKVPRRRYHCCIDATTSTVVKSIWLPSLRDRSKEVNRGERLGGGGVGEVMDIDQMHVQTNSPQARHTKNNVAWATLAPTVWRLSSEFSRVRQNIWQNIFINIICYLGQCSHVWSYCYFYRKIRGRSHVDLWYILISKI